MRTNGSTKFILMHWIVVNMRMVVFMQIVVIMILKRNQPRGELRSGGRILPRWESEASSSSAERPSLQRCRSHWRLSRARRTPQWRLRWHRFLLDGTRSRGPGHDCGDCYGVAWQPQNHRSGPIHEDELFWGGPILHRRPIRRTHPWLEYHDGRRPAVPPR